MSDLIKNNESFCLVPWIHSHISPQGSRQICCVAEYDFGINTPLDEIWNCDEMKDIRKKMLKGETLPMCNRCNGGTLNPNTYRDYFNKQYSKFIEKAFKKTSRDGTYEEYPITFDYRTNICNFKCKMCNEEYSSQIQSEKVQNGLELKFNILNSKEKEKSLSIIDNEFSNNEILKNVSEIYWCGGEPIYWKTHWETLDRLIEKNYAKNVRLRYNSNLSTIEYKGKLLTDYFTHFKDIQFLCSLDGTGNIGEWIRSNLNYDKWKNNFSKLIEFRNENKKLEVLLAITVTTPTLFDFENLYELCMEFNVKPDFQTCFSTTANNLLSPKAFPKKLIKPILDDFINSHLGVDNEIIDKFRKYVEFLFIQDFFENDESYLNDLKTGVDNIKHLEKNRPHTNITFEDILKHNQPLFEFYLNIK